LALGEAALMAADEITARAAFAEAQTWFEDQKDYIASARAAYGCGIAHWRLDEAASARQALEAALALLDTTPHPEPVAVQILVALANLLGVVLGRQDEAIQHGRQALEIAQQLGDGALQASAGRTVGFLLVRDNDLAAGIPLLEQALVQAQSGSDPVEAAVCCAYLAQAYCWSAALERSRTVSLLREMYTHTCLQPHQQSYVYTWLAFLNTLRGAWAEAEKYLALAQPAVACVASLEPRAFFQQVQGFLAFQQGDYRQAERELRAGVEVFRNQDPGELLLCLGLFGLALLATGKHREARACMAEQERLIETLAAGSLSMLSARGCVALMAVQVNDAERAASHYTDLLACRGQHHWFLVDRILGEIATLAGEWSNAADHLDQALHIAEREGLLPEKGRILIAQANLELAQGRPGNMARARRRLTEALALFRDLRSKSLVRQIRQRLSELPQEPSTQSIAATPAALSPREVEVLCLVAAGKRNREIAQALNISASTVAKHLTTIFDKTGCENRAAATAFAFRHGLA
jgi:ATP/maltotriose-dependent transcriptional regulator MalT